MNFPRDVANTTFRIFRIVLTWQNHINDVTKELSNAHFMILILSRSVNIYIPLWWCTIDKYMYFILYYGLFFGGIQRGKSSIQNTKGTHTNHLFIDNNG